MRKIRSAPLVVRETPQSGVVVGHAAPAMYLATRPHFEHRSVTCERGGGGICCGSRMICPEHDGHDNGDPVRSCEMSCRACAGLYVAGRGFRMGTSVGIRPTIPAGAGVPAETMLRVA